MFIRRIITVVLGICLTVLAMQTMAHEGEEHGQKAEKAKVKTGAQLTGEVIDIVCYTRHDSRGPKHIKCAKYCAGLGIPMGILEAKTGEIYMVFPKGHSDPNEKIMPYIGKQVKVEGTVHEKGGVKGVTIKEISEVKE